MSPRLSFARRIQFFWFAIFDRRTPFLAKLLFLMGVLYGISPIDMVPDFLPILGQLDDAGVLIFVVLVFLKSTKKIRKEMSKK